VGEATGSAWKDVCRDAEIGGCGRVERGWGQVAGEWGEAAREWGMSAGFKLWGRRLWGRVTGGWEGVAGEGEGVGEWGGGGKVLGMREKVWENGEGVEGAGEWRGGGDRSWGSRERPRGSGECLRGLYCGDTDCGGELWGGGKGLRVREKVWGVWGMGGIASDGKGKEGKNVGDERAAVRGKTWGVWEMNVTWGSDQL
jgi:hypothetical protein